MPEYHPSNKLFPASSTTPIPPHSGNIQRRPFLIPMLCLLLLAAILHLAHTTHLLPLPSLSTPGSTTCNNLLHDTDYTKYISFQEGRQELSAIEPVNQLVGGLPAVLVPVTSTDSAQRLDLYIYGCSMQHALPQLHLLFKQQNLLQGSVQISRQHTLLVGSLDPTLSNRTGLQIEPWQQDIYQEYAWQQDSFVPVTFPGFYPVLTRGEAEQLQSQFDAGQELPWSNPLLTGRQMALDLLHWSSDTLQSQLQSSTLTTAHIRLTHRRPFAQLQLTLQRLVRADQHGLWFITSAQSSGLTLPSNQFLPQLRTPASIYGTLGHRPGACTITLLNHLLTPLPLLSVPTLMWRGASFATTLLYTNNVPGQRGILLLACQTAPKSKRPAQIFLTGVTLS